MALPVWWVGTSGAPDGRGLASQEPDVGGGRDGGMGRANSREAHGRQGR
ncbi:hypothetical protein [Streptomyces sp. NPDC048419]